MFKGTQVSWLALVGALAVAPLGSAAFSADSSTPAPDPTLTQPADPAAAPAAEPERKGDDVTVVEVDPAPKAEGTLAELVPGQLTAEELIGKSVTNANGDTIGEISDLVLDRDKAVYAVLSVGGFLGIGADYVAVPFEKMQITTDTEGDAQEVRIVANVTEDDLQQLAAQQRGEDTGEEAATDTVSEAARSTPPEPEVTEPAAGADATATTETMEPVAESEATATVETTEPAAGSEATTATGDAEPAEAPDPEIATAPADTGSGPVDSTSADQPVPGDEQQVAAVYANMTAADLIGKTVVNSAGETVGDIEDLVIDDQKIVMAVVSVGGFLGIGEKYVAVPLEQLTLSEDKATLGSGLTKEDLEAMPAYEKGTLQDIEKDKPLFGKS